MRTPCNATLSEENESVALLDKEKARTGLEKDKSGVRRESLPVIMAITMLIKLTFYSGLH